MIRVIFTLIIITFWLPAVLFLSTDNYRLSPLMSSYGMATFLIGLLVLTPLTFCCISINCVKLWKFMLAASIIGTSWAFALTVSILIEFRVLIFTAVLCSAHAMVFWVIALWKNPVFIIAINKRRNLLR